MRQLCEVSNSMWFLGRYCWRFQVLWGITPCTLVYSWRNAREFCCIRLMSAIHERCHEICQTYVPLDSKFIWRCRSECEWFPFHIVRNASRHIWYLEKIWIFTCIHFYGIPLSYFNIYCVIHYRITVWNHMQISHPCCSVVDVILHVITVHVA
jgi:hypothetical protein